MSLKKLSDNVKKVKLDNGLNITVLSKPTSNKTNAYLVVHFGGAYDKYYLDGKLIQIPQGVAHFLEHKTFSMPDNRDISIVFSSLGLDVNAYTDYQNTVYTVSGVENIEIGLKELINFVFTPYMTDENVESEKEIIIQELLMYKDEPDELLNEGFMRNLFFYSPFTHDLAGTVEEVKKINAEILNKCYKEFYHPENMELVIVGNINSDEAINIVKDAFTNFKFDKFIKPILYYEKEPLDVKKEYNETTADVIYPQVMMGLKLPVVEGNYLDRKIHYNCLKNYLFGYDTKFHQSLLDKKLIIGNLKKGVCLRNIGSYFYFYANTPNPQKLIKVIKNRLDNIDNFKISKSTLERYKKASIGSYIKGFNSIDYLTDNIIDGILNDYDFFDKLNNYNNISMDNIQNVVNEIKNAKFSAFVMYPDKKH